MLMNKIIHIVADPMCSWCWGFAPEVKKLRAAVAGRAAVHVIAGGLRPGTTEVMDAAMKEYISHHWEQVHEKTGQPFDHSLFERDDFIYDTEPGCRAMVTAREMVGHEVGLDMTDALHEAFYANAKDIAKIDVIVEVARGRGLDPAAFKAAFSSDEMGAKTQADFHLARTFGITGFPSIVCEEKVDGKSQFGFLTLGYQPFEGFAPLLEEWLGPNATEGGANNAGSEGDVCAPGGAC